MLLITLPLNPPIVWVIEPVTPNEPVIWAEPVNGKPTPLTPDVPLVPSTPSIPLVPSTPFMPDVPSIPLVPFSPLTPLVPSTPLVPLVPVLPFCVKLNAIISLLLNAAPETYTPFNS